MKVLLMNEDNFLKKNTLIEIQKIIDCLSAHTKFAYKLCIDWKKKNPNPSEMDAIGLCNLEMEILNVESIMSFYQGILIPYINQHHIDINSCACIVRSLYERVFIYHNIYVSPKTNHEKELLFNIWKIKGYNNFVKLKDIPEFANSIIIKRKEEIENSRKHIRNLLAQLKITTKVKNSILEIINKDSTRIKGFRFVKDKSGTIIKFDNISYENAGHVIFEDLNVKTLNDLYTFLSYSTHPSFWGTYYFGNSTNTDKHDYQLLLELTYLFFSTALVDFCKGNSGGMIFYENINNLIVKNHY